MHLRTVPSVFHARVIAARLGADGIVVTLGGNTGGPYPLGDVSVWVWEADAASARELLLADEVEAVFEPEPDNEPVPSRRALTFGLTRRQLLAGVGLALMVWATMAGRFLG